MRVSRQNNALLSLLVGAALAQACLASASTPAKGVEFSAPLDRITMENGTEKRFDVGIGSGACRLASDPDNVFYTITDRGPNIKTKDAKKVMGVDFKGKKGKIFPVPNFAPTIFKMKLEGEKVVVLDKIQLKNSMGSPITGISNPQTEAAWDINGAEIAYDPAGVDAEGIVKLQDGSFWIGEEYGPSILHVSADGRILERWVPEGVGASLTDAGYPVKENLPGILRERPLNRGIESMAASPDEKFLYFAMQSPLANPDKAAYQKSRNLRIFKIDKDQRKIVGEYLYLIDTPETFGMDNEKKRRKQSDVKVSELTAIGRDKLVVLERISNTTKFYLVDLSSGENILGSKWDKLTTTPTLEQTQPSNLNTLSKQLLLDSDDKGGLMKKIEGLAWFGDDRWIMVNDNDFGITGDPTYIISVTMPVK